MAVALARRLQNISIRLPRAIGPVLNGAMFHAGYLTAPFLLGAALWLPSLVLYFRFFGHLEAVWIHEP